MITVEQITAIEELTQFKYTGSIKARHEFINDSGEKFYIYGDEKYIHVIPRKRTKNGFIIPSGWLTGIPKIMGGK